MGTNECSQPASKSSWDSQDFGDISMVLKMAHFRKSTGPRRVNRNSHIFIEKNTFETVVCEMAVILSLPQCVKIHGHKRTGDKIHPV